ncbi:MAG: dTMP kinase [Armatimonadota bacterium]
MNKGLFITIEGPEGAGKTLQTARLCEALETHRIPCLATREPGGPATAEAIRRVVLGEKLPPAAETLLFLAARAVHVEYVIRPALNEGRTVVCDRFTDSTIAYQGYGLGLDLPTLRQMCSFATGGLEPDITFLLDIPPELGIQRRYAANHGPAAAAKRGQRRQSADQLTLALSEEEAALREAARSRIEERGLSFHQRVRQGFLEEARLHPHRIRVVDATLPPDQITDLLTQAVLDALAKLGGNP